MVIAAWTVETLVAFEERVRQAFLAKKIRAPVHLSGNNEAALLEYFKDVKQTDYVFSNWRSHYHALLHGVPADVVMEEILQGRSMYLMNYEHRFFCSSIVGGILPIAAGVALGVQKLGKSDTVWCFIGDMTARTGIYAEFCQYCAGHELPVRVVVEDNGLSTDTPTNVVWGESDIPLRVSRYCYERKWPHVGVGQRVSF